MKITTKSLGLINKAVINAAFMLAGTAIGAGMLAIPVVTAEVGFLSSIWVTFFVWAYMFLTGIILMEVSVSMKESGSFLKMAEKYLPFYGKQIIGFLFIFLYGTLMIGYISAASEIIQALAGSSLGVKFFFPLILMLLLSMHRDKIVPLISKLTVPMGVFFLIFYVMGFHYIGKQNLLQSNFSKFYMSVPVLFSAFGYHNIIPTLSKYLKYDRKKLRAALLLGSLIPCIVYILWQALILGIVDIQTLQQAKMQGIPVVVLLGQITGNHLFGLIGTSFAFFAILTSVLGVGLSLIDFLELKSRRSATFFVVFLPFLITFFCSGIFFKAQAFAGGFGEVILNGIIPVCMYYFYTKRQNIETNKNLLLFSLFMIGFFVIVVEIRGILLFLFQV